MADQKTKKKVKKNVPAGVAHIKASFNNTIINISNPSGETIVWTSGGSVGFKGSRKSTPYAAQVAAEEAVRRATEYGVQKLDIIISGTGAGRETAVRTLQNMGNKGGWPTCPRIAFPVPSCTSMWIHRFSISFNPQLIKEAVLNWKSTFNSEMVH